MGAGRDGVTTVIRSARLPGDQEPVDLLVRDGVLEAIRPRGVVRLGAAREVDAEGRTVLPGLWDEHTHMVQWALAMSRLDCSTADSAAQIAELVRDAPGRGPLVGYGFRDSLWPDAPSARALDDAGSGRAVILVSADLHCAWVSTAGARLLDVPAEPDGLVREGPWFAAMARLDEVTDTAAEQALSDALPMLPARGVVGVVDLEWADNLADWTGRLTGTPGLVRVEAGFYPDRLDQMLAQGRTSGALVEGTGGLLRVGPLKILSDGSLNTRTAHCRLPYRDTAAPASVPAHSEHGGYGHQEYSRAQMQDLIVRAHAGGLQTTIHAIGDLAVTTALDAFEAAGVPGRIEHAQLVRLEDQPRFAELGVVASVQPEHAMDDRDVIEAYWPDRADRCFPLASLARAGTRLRLGSDAPVAPLDPWVAISAAVTRSRDGRPAWHPEQSIDVPTALAASARGKQRLDEGDVADLILTDLDPVTASEQDLRRMPVWATMLAGRWTHGPG